MNVCEGVILLYIFIYFFRNSYSQRDQPIPQFPSETPLYSALVRPEPVAVLLQLPNKVTLVAQLSLNQCVLGSCGISKQFDV